MTVKLIHESVIPLYHQLKEILKENIYKDEWKPGDKIPSEYQLMERFEVSRNTVKKALEDLVQEGVLYRIQGKGTFVSKPKLEQSLTGFYSFSRVLKEKGLNPNDIILGLEIKKAQLQIAQQLNLDINAEIVELRRLRCANDEPIILETSFLPKKVVPNLNIDDLRNHSLYQILMEKYDIIVSRAKEVFEPVLIGDYESKLLKSREGYPALLLERTAFDSNENPVEFCRSIVRGDRCRFYTELF